MASQTAAAAKVRPRSPPNSSVARAAGLGRCAALGVAAASRATVKSLT